MAHKKGAGSSKNGRESQSKRLGVKIFGGQAAIAGNILIRQRGTKHHPGNNVGIGKDHTLYALTDGLVEFTKKANNRSFVSIIPFEENVVLEEKAPEKKAASKTTKGDDLAKIEGIGPKLATVLGEAGISTFAQLAAASVEDVQKILDEAEGNYARFNPETWPAQAQLAADGKWDELKAWQDELNGGKTK